MLQVVQAVKTEAAPGQAAADQAYIGLLVMGRREVDPGLHQQRLGEAALAVVDHGEAVVEVVEQEPIHRGQAVDRVQLEGRQRQFGQHVCSRQRCQRGAHAWIETGIQRGRLAVAQRGVGVVVQLTELGQLPRIADAAGGVEGDGGKRRHFLQGDELRRGDQRTAVVEGHDFALEGEAETFVLWRPGWVLQCDGSVVTVETGLPLRVQRQRGARCVLAIALPDGAHGRIEMVGKPLAVAHRRAHQHFAQMAANTREAVEVAGQFDHALLIVLPTVHHQFRQPGVDQVRGRVTPGERRAGERHHRHAHQQGLAGGEAAGIRPRVEGDVDAVVGVEQAFVAHRALDQHTLFGNALGRHEAVHMAAQLAVAERAALEQQA